MSEHDNTQPERSVDKLLEDLEAEKAARSREEERLGEVLKVDEHTAAKISEERKNKVSGFKLDIDLDEEFQKTEEPAPPSVNDTEEPAPSGEPAEETAESLDEDEPAAEPEGPKEEADGKEPEEEPEEAGRGKKKKKTKKSTWGCVRGIIYAVLVLGISGVLAYFTITGAIDLAGLGKSSGKVDVVIPRGASTQQVADALKEGGVIDQPLVFRLYSKLTKADGHIDWDEKAAVIHARIRGVTPWPGAQTVFLLPGRDPLPALLQPGRVGEAFTGGQPDPGTLIALRDGKLLIACRDALYEVSMLKPAGSKPMSAEAFWNGYCRSAGRDGCGRAVSPGTA